jgi:hypothetical protein
VERALRAYAARPTYEQIKQAARASCIGKTNLIVRFYTGEKDSAFDELAKVRHKYWMRF